VELPLVISDHADWDELTATIAQVNPAETWITHGREEALLRWCELHQRKAARWRWWGTRTRMTERTTS
jgi:putative mRNA 3-end processing factor